MRILALDPSFTETGWCVGDSENGWSVIDGNCIKTRSQASDSGVKTTDDQTRRLRFIARTVEDIIDKYDPELISAEYQPGWTSKKTAKTSGMLISLIVNCALFTDDLPLEWYQPDQVKKIVLGKRSGTKQDIRDELNPKYPHLPGFYGDTKYQTEAVGDAAAVLHCSIHSSDLVKALS